MCIYCIAIWDHCNSLRWPRQEHRPNSVAVRGWDFDSGALVALEVVAQVDEAVLTGHYGHREN